MRNGFNFCSLLIAIPLLLYGADQSTAQPSQLQPTALPFTSEEVAVYRAFFADHFRGKSQREPIAVSEFTLILQPDEGDYSDCMKGFPQNEPPQTIRRLTEDFAKQNNLRIVDPKLHKIQDPEEGMRSGLSVESAVKSGLSSGILTISEIIFDKKHKRAAFRYSFYCGGLCGHAETVVYEKNHQGWKPTKLSCGFGIS
jgi:hypothetical protein